MHLNRTKMTPYQDPVNASDLREQNVYYRVICLDDKPIIDSLIFIDNNLEPDDLDLGGFAYFQDSTSFLLGITYYTQQSSIAIQPRFLKQPLDNLNGIYEFKSAVEILICKLFPQSI